MTIDIIREHAIFALRSAIADLPFRQVLEDIEQMRQERENELEAAESDAYLCEKALENASAGSDLHVYSRDEREAIQCAEFALLEARNRLLKAQEAQ